MKVFAIKAIVERTNPTILREIRIEGSRTVKELIAAVILVILVDEKKAALTGRLSGGKGNIGQNGKLADCLSVGEFYRLESAKNFNSAVRLEVLSFEEEEHFYAPSLTRFREASYAMRLYDNWEEELYSDTGRSTRVLEVLNRRLLAHFCPEKIPPKFHWDIARSLEKILDRENIPDIRTWAREQGITCPTGLRKKEMITALVGQVNQETWWKKLLGALPLSEYRNLKTLCLNGRLKELQSYYIDEIFPELWQHKMIDIDHNRLVAARELMKFMERWLMEGAEEEYLPGAALRNVLSAAGKLYGAFDAEAVLKLMASCYPEYYDEKMIRNTLETKPSFLNGRIRRLTADAWYLVPDISEEKGRTLLMTSAQAGGVRFYPDREYLERIAIESYFFDEDMADDMLQFLSKDLRLYQYDIPGAMRYLQHAAYLGLPEDVPARYLAERCGYKLTGTPVKRMKDFWRANIKRFRLMSLGGLTTLEFEKLAAKPKSAAPAARRIYPNEPCPCGSGKKYKYCCGRNA